MKFGRRSNEQLGAVDPTGSYCAMPDDWIKKKLAEAAVNPTRDDLLKSEYQISGVFEGYHYLWRKIIVISILLPNFSVFGEWGSICWFWIP